MDENGIARLDLRVHQRIRPAVDPCVSTSAIWSLADRTLPGKLTHIDTSSAVESTGSILTTASGRRIRDPTCSSQKNARARIRSNPYPIANQSRHRWACVLFHLDRLDLQLIPGSPRPRRGAAVCTTPLAANSCISSTSGSSRGRRGGRLRSSDRGRVLAVLPYVRVCSDAHCSTRVRTLRVSSSTAAATAVLTAPPRV